MWDGSGPSPGADKAFVNDTPRAVVAMAHRPRESLGRFIRDEAGDLRLLQRPMLVFPFPHLFCPSGHRLWRSNIALEEDTYHCDLKLAGGARCNRYLYVLSDFHTRTSDRLQLAIEVTSDEIKRFRRMGLVDKLLYLGVMSADPRTTE